MEDIKPIDYQAILTRIDYCLKNSSYNSTDLAEYLGKNRQIFTDWKHKAGRKPGLEDLLRISKFFGIPFEFLIYGDDSPIDDATAAFIVSTQGFTEEQKKIIFASIKAQVDIFKNLNEEKK